MPAYRTGSTGPEVVRLQQRLAALGLYDGTTDGVFGGGTESAVRRFQRGRAGPIDGVVGAADWAALFGGETIPVPAIVAEPLPTRCLALSAAFETGTSSPECFAGVAGDFDGMGMSFGVLQWNLGTGTLQPLLRGLDAAHPMLFDDVFHGRAAELRRVLAAPRADQLAWARAIQHAPRARLDEPWLGMFKTLGRRPESRAAQTAAAGERYLQALRLCTEYALGTERGIALMFDIVVQNGSIPTATAARIRAELAALPPGSSTELEVARMTVIAERRAEAARPQFVADVRDRKLTIAHGEGTVHGRQYDLADDFGITLAPVDVATADAPRSITVPAMRGPGG